MKKPSDGITEAMRDFADLSSADRRAIMHRLSIPERRTLNGLMRRERKPDTKRRLAAQQNGKEIFKAYSPWLSKQLQHLFDPRRHPTVPVTPATRKALEDFLARQGGPNGNEG